MSMEEEMRQDNAEPTYFDLQRAWSKAINAEGIPGSQAEALQELQALRDAKWTWPGAQENDLRYALDNYLKGKLSHD